MKVVSIKNKKDFDAVFSQNTSFGNRHFTLLYRQNGLSFNRLGIIISKKISKKAVVRNKLRRQIREIYRTRQDEIQQGYDLIIIPKSRCLDVTFEIIQDSFMHLFFKQNLMKKEIG